MTIKRILVKFSKVAFGLLGISVLVSSCAKEKTCTCSFSYFGFSEEAFTLTAKTKDDCEDLEIDLTQSYSAGATVSCK